MSKTIRRVADLRKDRAAISPFAQRILSTYDEQELKLKQVKAMLSRLGVPNTFDEYVDELSKPMSTALEMLHERAAYRPNGDPSGLKVLAVLREAFKEVVLTERGGGRYDVNVTLDGKVWGKNLPDASRILSNRVVTTALGEQDVKRRLLEEAIASERFVPSPGDLMLLAPLDDCRVRFPTMVELAVHVMTMAVVLAVPPKMVMTTIGCSGNFIQKFSPYWKTPEAGRVREQIAKMHRASLDENKSRVRRSSIPTLRQRLLMSPAHIIMLHPLTDPSSGETEISDTDWDALVVAGVAKPNGQLLSSDKRSDRRFLNGWFWVVRNGTRWEDIPRTFRPHNRIQQLLKRLDDSGTSRRIVHALLSARDVPDLPNPKKIPRLNQKERLQVRNGKARRMPANYDPNVLKRGRRPLLEKRRANLAKRQDERDRDC